MSLQTTVNSIYGKPVKIFDPIRVGHAFGLALSEIFPVGRKNGPRDRAMAWDILIDDMPVREASSRHGLSTGRVYAFLGKAMRRLRHPDSRALWRRFVELEKP
jgi:hypothetical protein